MSSCKTYFELFLYQEVDCMPKKNTKSPNGSHSVYKTKDGKWVGQIVIGKNENGTLKYKRFKSDKQYVVLEKIREFEQGFVRTKDATKSYLEDFLDGYLFNVKKNVLKPSSFDRDVRTGNLIKKYIGNYTLEQLTTPFFQSELINKLKDDDYSYSTIHKVYVLLNECLQYAVDTDKLNKNPCKLVKQPPRKIFETKEIRWLTEEEIQQFKEQASSTYKNGKPKYIYGLAISLVIYTGLRCGELSALKWSNIDFENKTINVAKNIITAFDYDGVNRIKARTQIQDSTKTSKGRKIPLIKSAENILNSIKSQYKEINPDGFIINNSDKMVMIQVLSRSYLDIANACGIANPLGIHTLRHTFASLLIKKGVDIKIVSEILGHKDVSFTYNVYVHILEEQKIQAMNLLDDI